MSEVHLTRKEECAVYYYSTGRNFHWNLNFANDKFDNFKLHFLLFFRNLSMIAYIIEMQNSKFANI